MILANGVSPAQRGGVKRLNGYLTTEQRATIEAMPPPGANSAEIVGANLALARIFLPLAREMIGRAGGAWPAALEAATGAHLQRTLGVSL